MLKVYVITVNQTIVYERTFEFGHENPAMICIPAFSPPMLAAVSVAFLSTLEKPRSSPSPLFSPFTSSPEVSASRLSANVHMKRGTSMLEQLAAIFVCSLWKIRNSFSFSSSSFSFSSQVTTGGHCPRSLFLLMPLHFPTLRWPW